MRPFSAQDSRARAQGRALSAAPAMAASSIGRLGMRLGGVGAAHPAAPFRGPLLLIQPTPGAVLFRPGYGVGEAFRANRASGAHGLRLALAHLALRLALSIRPEEEHDILASARGGVLPSPTRPRRHGHVPTYLRHESVSLISRVFSGQASTLLLATRSHVLRH